MQTNGPVQRRRLGFMVVSMPSQLVAQQNIVLYGKEFGGVVLKKRRVHAMGHGPVQEGLDHFGFDHPYPKCERHVWLGIEFLLVIITSVRFSCFLGGISFITI